MITFAIVLTGVTAIAIVWLLIADRRELDRLYKEMETMTPKDAYRRGLVLKYLPQCQFDMDEINTMVDEVYPAEPSP